MKQHPQSNHNNNNTRPTIVQKFKPPKTTVEITKSQTIQNPTAPIPSNLNEPESEQQRDEDHLIDHQLEHDQQITQQQQQQQPQTLVDSDQMSNSSSQNDADLMLLGADMANMQSAPYQTSSNSLTSSSSSSSSCSIFDNNQNPEMLILESNHNHHHHHHTTDELPMSNNNSNNSTTNFSSRLLKLDPQTGTNGGGCGVGTSMNINSNVGCSNLLGTTTTGLKKPITFATIANAASQQISLNMASTAASQANVCVNNSPNGNNNKNGSNNSSNVFTNEMIEHVLNEFKQNFHIFYKQVIDLSFINRINIFKF